MQLLLEGPDIDALLERVKDEHGEEAHIVRAEQRLVGGVRGFFARRRFEVTVELEEPPAGASPSAVALGVDRPIDPIAALLARADRQDGPAAAAKAGADAPSLSRQPGSASGFDAVLAPLVAPLLARAGSPAASTAATAPVAPPPTVPAQVAAAVVAPTGRPLREVESALRAVGLPPSALGREPLPPDARLALIEVLEREATPASERVCGVLAVVGAAKPAGAVARAIMRHAGLPSGALVTAARVARAAVTCEDPDGAMDAVVRSRLRAHAVAVVVVEADSSRAGAERAGRVCAAIDASTLVAVVDATRSTPVLRQWLQVVEAVGCRVDQIAAYNIAEHPEPSSVLALHRPVTWLDATVATVGAWAGLCLDRLPRV